MSASSAASSSRLRSLPSRTAAWDDDAEQFAAPRLRPSTVYACDGAEVPPYVYRSEGFAEDLGQEYGIG
jgi:hypothetical protein